MALDIEIKVIVKKLMMDLGFSDEFEKTLSKEIKRIEKKFNFSIEDHRLELFGKCTDICENCSWFS